MAGWGKRKDGQAYPKDGSKKGIKSSSTKPVADVHLKAMSIDRENVWERISEIPEIIQADIRPNANKFIHDSEMDFRGQRWTGEVLDWCDREFDLEVNNINWVGDFIEERRSYEFEIHRVKNLVMDSAMYWVDHGFGYEEEVDKRPKNEGEKLGQQLFEIFKKMDEEKFENYDSRREDYVLAKKIVQAYVESQYQLLKRELNKIRDVYPVKK